MLALQIRVERGCHGVRVCAKTIEVLFIEFGNFCYITVDCIV
jgi:hypothetical protein